MVINIINHNNVSKYEINKLKYKQIIKSCLRIHL